MKQAYNIHTDGKRLSPLSIISGFIRQAPSLGLMIYFAFFRSSGFDYFNLFILVFIGFFTFPSIFLRYYYFKYLITPTEIIVYSGVLNKKQRHIPIKKIQNVNIQQSFINRILGLSKVQFETAGDSGTEGIFDSVKTSLADEIKQQIKSYQYEVIPNMKPDLVTNEAEGLHHKETSDLDHSKYVEKVEEQSNTDREPKSKTLIKMSVKDLAKYGFLRFRPVLLLVFGWSIGMFQKFMPDEFSNLDDYVGDGLTPVLDGIDDITLYFYIAGFVVLAFIISWLADVVLTVIQYYGFYLSRESGKLMTDYGLLGKRSNAIPLKKLQMMTLKTNWIRFKLGYWGMNLETAGSSMAQTRGPETVIPFSKWDKVLEISKGILKFNLPDEFSKISSMAIRRIFIRYIIMLAVLCFGLSFVIESWYWSLLLLPILFFLSLLRWRARGYHIDDDKLIIKEGWFYKRIKILKISKIQNVIIQANIFQQNLGLASVIVDTAANNGLNGAIIPDIELERAKEIQNQLLNEFHKVS